MTNQDERLKGNEKIETAIAALPAPDPVCLQSRDRPYDSEYQ